MSRLPLIAGYDPQAPIACQRGRTASASQFIGAAHALADRLPESGAVLLLCEDRIAFALGFAATLLRGSTALLPPSRAPLALERIASARTPACALVDAVGTISRVPEMVVDPWSAQPCIDEVPRIDGDRIAVIVHTSGTTGEPQPHEKTWSSLVRGAAALRDRVGFTAGSAVVGAVPPQHMWGLEATIMMALQGGGIVHASTPLLPADIAAALEDVAAPRWLVATPLHLRSCVRSGAQLPALRGALTAAAPLDRDVAAQFEAAAGAPVIEIYGSTESGVIGTRRTVTETAFVPLAGVRVERHGEHIEVREGHLDRAVIVRDRATVHDDGSLTLTGRDADMVKIGGKRTSLAMLNQQLLSIPGVVDGAFVVVDEATPSQRLAAIAVAPTLGAEAIIAGLRERLDSVFIPRPLHLTAALPRNALGKLPDASLRELLRSLSPGPRDRGAATTYVCEVVVPATHAALPGHFPGRPIVPAAWILTLVASACHDAWGCAAPSLHLQRARFRAPLLPDAKIRIELVRADDRSIAFVCTHDATRIADGAFVIGERGR